MSIATNSSFILIVDDNPTNLSVLSEALGSAGLRFRVAVDGESALAQVERNQPDLILLDVQMPGIGGFETCRRLKENPVTESIPVIFTTALADTENKAKGFSLGAVDYITKPLQAVEVLARVKTHLQLRTFTKTLEQQVEQRTAELSQALQQLQSSQMQLIQSEKMSALGNLVAGVAHEINNPIGFVSGNLNHLENYLKDLLHLIELYQHHYTQPVATIQSAIEDMDLDYMRADAPKLIHSTQEGMRRLKHISTSLRTFSRADSDLPVSLNLHEGLDSTLLILKHRLKSKDSYPGIEVIREYGALPEVECYAGQLNQVFMNLLANAIDALEESNAGRSLAELQANPNKITIQTELSDDQQFAVIRIQDNGVGMTNVVRQKIFNHLFTTKEVGKGTGLGLAIAHQIVVEKHGGTIEVTSAPGEGTEFIIRLPVERPEFLEN